MSRKIVLPIAVVLLVAGVAGCNKSDGENAIPNGVELVNKLTSDPVKGYKSFTFGMPAVQVAQLPECIESYKQSFDLPDNTEKYREKLTDELQRDAVKDQAEIAQIQQLVAEYDEYRTLNRCDQEGQSTTACQPNHIAKFADIDSKTARLKELLGKGEEVNKKVAEFAASNASFGKRVAEFAPDIIEMWAKDASCNVEFMGKQQTLRPVFEQGKLISVVMPLGEFNNEKYQSLVAALSEKYDLTHEVTDEQVSAFNEAQLNEVVSTFADGQIGLYATNKNDIGMIQYEVEGGHNTEGYYTLNRYMRLVYSDAAHASKITAAASVGKTKTDDL